MCIWNREDIRDERPVDAGGAIVARDAAHAVVDADRWGDVDARVAEAQATRG